MRMIWFLCCLSGNTEKELSQGFEVVWVSLEDAISKIEGDNPEDYTGSFIRERDLEFLKKVEGVVGLAKF